MAVDLTLKRNLKRSKLFEIQKITKRARLFEKRSGTDSQLQKNKRKRLRLLEELELIKDINLNSLAKEITEDSRLLGSSHNSPPTDLQERAKWRLLSSKAIQQKPLQTRKQQSIISSTSALSKVFLTSQEHTDQQSSESCGEEDTKKFQIHVRISDDDDDGSEESSSANKQLSPPLYARSTRRKARQRSAEVVYKSRSVTNDVVRESHKKGRDAHSALGTESIFVDSLGRQLSMKKMQRKRGKKSNRLGQRARRKQWEEMYGPTAKHIEAIQKAHKSKHLVKSRDTGERKKMEVPKLMKGPNDGANAVEEEPLHPSWAASKSRKNHQRTLQFLGQKIVFSDSDID